MVYRMPQSQIWFDFWCFLSHFANLHILISFLFLAVIDIKLKKKAGHRFAPKLRLPLRQNGDRKHFSTLLYNTAFHWFTREKKSHYGALEKLILEHCEKNYGISNVYM